MDSIKCNTLVRLELNYNFTGGAVIACFVAVLVFAYVSGLGWSNKEINESKRYGNTISIGLESYKKQYGKYPETLELLEPKFVLNVPPPTAGNEIWDYIVEKEGFYLGVTGNDEIRDPVLFRSNRSAQWYYDSK